MDFPEPRLLREIVERYAGLVERFGADLGSRPLVLPTREFFPDHYMGDPVSVQRFLARMQSHAGLSDVPITVRLVDADGEGGACGTGACGSCATVESPLAASARLLDLGDSWQIAVAPAEVRAPVALGAALAQALAHVFLLEETSAARPIEEPLPVTIELTAVGLGLGSLVLQASYIYQKSCGGPSIARLTELSCGELAVVVALFARASGHSLRPLRAAMPATQRELLAEAETWVRSNPSLPELLRRDPLRLSLGDFELSEAKPWLVRLLSGFSSARVDA